MNPSSQHLINVVLPAFCVSLHIHGKSLFTPDSPHHLAVSLYLSLSVHTQHSIKQFALLSSCFIMAPCANQQRDRRNHSRPSSLPDIFLPFLSLPQSFLSVAVRIAIGFLTANTSALRIVYYQGGSAAFAQLYTPLFPVCVT